MGLTIVDGVDTLLIMGLTEEAQEARQWIANHLNMQDRRVSVSLNACFLVPDYLPVCLIRCVHAR